MWNDDAKTIPNSSFLIPNWIVAAFAERIATKYSPQSHQSAA